MLRNLVQVAPAVREDAALSEVARLMSETRSGAVLVTDDLGNLVGVICERQLEAALDRIAERPILLSA